jgi:hypothetical protein
MDRYGQCLKASCWMTAIIKQFEWDLCSTAMDITMTSAFIHYLHLPPRVDEVRGK